MKKFLLTLMLLFLVACGGQETVAEPTAEPVEEVAVVEEVEEPTEEAVEETAVVAEPTAVPEPEPTAVPVEEAEPEEEADEEAEGETTADLSPAEVLADASMVRTEDWAKGSSEPLITIIEYGDFQ